MKTFGLYAILLLACACGAEEEPPKPPFQPLHPEKLKLVARLGETRFRHAGSMTAIVQLPGTGQVLTTSRDASARLWDSKTGAELKRFTSSEDLWGVTLLPDGKTALLSGGDKLLTLVDLQAFQALKTFKGHDAAVFRTALLAGGTKCVSGSNNGKVFLWDLQKSTFNELKGMSKSVYSVAVSPDEKLIAGGGEKAAIIWNAVTCEKIRELADLTSDTHTLAFSPDGRTLASCSSDKTVRLWEAESGKQLWSVEPGNGMVLAFSPTGDRLVVSVNESKNNSIRVFSAADGKELMKIEDAYEAHWPCCFTPDGKEILVGANVLSRWDAQSGKQIDGPAEHSHSSEIISLSLAPDGALYSLGQDRRAIHWDLATGKGKQIYRGDATWRDTSLNAGKRLLIAARSEKSLEVWDALAGKKIHDFESQSLREGAVFSTNQDLLLAWTYNDFSIFDLGAGTKRATIRPHSENGSSSINHVAYHNGVIATAQENGIVTYWDGSGVMLDEITVSAIDGRNGVRRCAFLNNGAQLVTVTQKGNLNLWTRGVEAAANGQPADLRTALKQLGDDDFNTRENAVTTLVSGGDKTIELLNSAPQSKDPEVVRLVEQVRAKLRKAVLPMRRVEKQLEIDNVQQIVACPDGIRFAISAGTGVNAQLWICKVSTAGPEIVCRICDGFSPNALCFSGDGKTLYVGNRDSTISVYSLGE